MIAIISDVHGNYPALRAVLDEIDKIGVSQIISLGDVSGYYCMINECVEEFRKRKITNLLGNHDSYLLGMGKCSRSTSVNLCIDYQKKIITEENLSFIRNSVMSLDEGQLSARHGGWKDPVDEYIYTFDFSEVEGIHANIFCAGHTHIQSLARYEEKTFFNPGSVGQPRDGNPKAAFAVIDDAGGVSLQRVSYDIDEISQKMKDAGFDERIYNCLYLGLKIGQTVNQ